MELMQWTKEKPKEDGYYWAYAKGWAEIAPVLIQVKDGRYRPAHSPAWRRVEEMTKQYVFAGPVQPPDVDSVMAYEPERRRAERVRV